jgi:7,8-dihydroneopterin aldolase/epimerase/oxygenase
MTGDPAFAGTQLSEKESDEELEPGRSVSRPGADTDSGPIRSGLDRISLHGISAHGYHGVFDFERARGQRFVVDVICWLDLSAAADTDDLDRTLDYGSLAASIVADIEGPSLNLIEALALRIARTCLSSPRVQTAQVTVHKPDAPIRFAEQSRAEVADVAVTLTISSNSGPSAGDAVESIDG